MSQFNPVIGSGKSGAQYRSDDNNGKSAIMSHHKGDSAPPYAVSGMTWLDDTSSPWVLKLYDGSDWITIGTFDASSDTFTPDTSGLGSCVNLDEMTAAQFRNNTADKVVSTDQLWSAAAEVTLSDGANISLDMDTGINFTVTLGGSRTLDNPTNAKVGQTGFIRVVQDGTGSRTLSFGTNYEFAAGEAPTLTTTASAEDMLFYCVISSSRILISSVLDVQ